MSLGERLSSDYLAAYKSRDTVRVSVLRLLRTAMTNRLVELKQPGGTLDDADIMDLLLKQAKQRRDSIAQYTAANRRDLADKEEQELRILEEYLPKALSGAELEAAIAAAIAEAGASGPQDMGRVIGLVMGRFRGQVDGKAVADAVKQKLG